MLFVVTGGTIDKEPVYLPDGSFDNNSKVFDKTHMPEMLEKAGFENEYTFKTLFMVDSLDMTDKHRNEIDKTIQDSDEKLVIVTHGTDTMPETARYLARNKKFENKTIVLTGAMIPYSMGKISDAITNLKDAINFVQKLSPGVYVAMNGQAFDADNVRKDVEAGVFKKIK